MNKMKAIDQVSTRFGMPSKADIKKKSAGQFEKHKTIANVDSQPIYYDECATGIDGHARIIKYVNHSISKYQTQDGKDEDHTGFGLINEKPENLEIVEVSEGFFKDGKKNGYCRVISADGSCEVGFYEDDEPKGKFCKYNPDGSYALEEGLYEGYQKCTKPLTIANYTSRITKSQKDHANTLEYPKTF